MIGPLVFWLATAGLIYVYVGYPLAIALLARLFPKPVRKGECAGRVSVLISAHNEERVIASKIRNLLALNGAERIREILVGSDGSSDRTVAEARTVSDPRVRVVEFPARRGKAAVLNDLMKMSTGDIVVMTDARQEIAQEALVALLRNFADPGVGVVSGELVFRATASAGTPAAMESYWNYEKRIRKAEATFHSVPGATGALYAIRRELLQPIPQETLLDDVVIPMQAVAAGYRCVFEPEAVVWDVPSADASQEAIRKRRTLAGNLQLVKLYPEWLLPGKNPIVWQFVSHKLARLTTPFLMLASLVGAMMSWRILSYKVLTILQVVLPCVALMTARRPVRSLKGMHLIRSFYAMQLAVLGAWWDAARGRYVPAWQRSVNS